MYLLPLDQQAEIEKVYSRKNIKRTVIREINKSEVLKDKILRGVNLLEEWLNGTYWESKQKRLQSFIMNVDLQEIVEEVFFVILMQDRPQKLTSLVGQVANLPRYTHQLDGIQTMAEVIAVLCNTDLYDIYKNNEDMGQLYVNNNFTITGELGKFIANTKYLPPMICNPKLLKDNNDSGYLTIKNDSVLLGKANHHTDDVCLDSLNKFNQISLSLDLDILNLYQEMPTKMLDTPEKEEAFEKMRKESLRVYVDIAKSGNEFYLTHKVDKRGRTYAQGYHINTQGTPFKKAIISLTKKEKVQGVPSL